MAPDTMKYDLSPRGVNDPNTHTGSAVVWGDAWAAHARHAVETLRAVRPYHLHTDPAGVVNTLTAAVKPYASQLDKTLASVCNDLQSVFVFAPPPAGQGDHAFRLRVLKNRRRKKLADKSKRRNRGTK